jgi:hypothetical protein
MPQGSYGSIVLRSSPITKAIFFAFFTIFLYLLFCNVHSADIVTHEGGGYTYKKVLSLLQSDLLLMAGGPLNEQ